MPDAASANTFDECGGDPASFVRQAFLALDGRRPLSQSEVDVYVELYQAAATLGDAPKDVVARAIMNRPEFADRWVEIVMDALHVQRLDIQTEAECWDNELRSTVSPALATAVRDHTAMQGGDGQPFTMLDLAKSSLALDDLSPIYRAQLFSLNSHPIPAANVGAVDAELARREDFGEHLRCQLPAPRRRVPRLPQQRDVGHRQRRSRARSPLAGTGARGEGRVRRVDRRQLAASRTRCSASTTSSITATRCRGAGARAAASSGRRRRSAWTSRMSTPSSRASRASARRCSTSRPRCRGASRRCAAPRSPAMRRSATPTPRSPGS